MKKKILVIVTAVIMTFMCVLGLVACGDEDIDGTYHRYEENMLIIGSSIKLEDGKATIKFFGDSTSGTYTVNGETVTVDIGGNTTYEYTLVSDGILKDSEGTYYCKLGYNPPKDDGAEE